MPIINWERLLAMEGDTTSAVSLLPFQASLLINLLCILQDNPSEYIEDIDDIDIEQFEDIVEEIQGILSEA